HSSSSQTTNPKTPSPNYFGFQGDDTSSFLRDSPHHTKTNWSPPSSAVRSTAAASPSIVPVDQNPDFDAFRRHSEGKAFNLGGLGGNFKMNAPPPAAAGGLRPKPGRTASKMSTPSEPRNVPPVTKVRSKELLDPNTAELARSPKRVLSPGSAAQLEPTRKGSPANFGDAERPSSQPRFQLPLDNPSGPQGFSHQPKRSETLPASTPSEAEQLMVTPQHVVTLMDSKTEDILLLDLRVSTQYAVCHVAGALNLCIPTTLLKRPSFNVQKLAETFKDEEQRRKFEHWRSSGYIIVYDASSGQLKDAQICLNMVKKFQNEGYEGTLHIVKGGFAAFRTAFAAYTEAGVDSAKNADELDTLPVAGGCVMPSTDKPANPFFGNIRQNMDLIGGVGQIPLKHPTKTSQSAEDDFPDWLRSAADDGDQGQKVSKKFEAIERREKKRMEDALSGNVSYNNTTTSSPRPRSGGDGSNKQQQQQQKGVVHQIAGIEKGNKNRYNNIWPFEHTRVKLQGVPKAGCDYFNGTFVQAGWSHKRYISTQAPIPATFNDFWNVIWQQDVRVIVMLTAEKEGAQVKAHNYWDAKTYGPLRLEFLSEKRASLEPARIHNSQRLAAKRPGTVKRASTRSSHPQIPLATIDGKEEKAGEQPYVIVRKFTLAHERHPFEPMREITQLQYSSWPDFGAPAHPAHLLGLVEQTDAVVRASNRDKREREPEGEGERPILVHCSAGCGRTGTFCTVDSVIDMLKRQRISQEGKGKGGGAGRERERREEVDGAWVLGGDVDLVEKTVEDFRLQRLSMVQSLRQFVLCYESVMEWLVEQ
ncbi:hypothetical protein BAUCODRAFT_40374, partial [Baudoinia panamericana UAMH 10762]